MNSNMVWDRFGEELGESSWEVGAQWGDVGTQLGEDRFDTEIRFLRGTYLGENIGDAWWENSKVGT